MPVNEHATTHQIADLAGSLSCITGVWEGNRNGDAVLRAIGLPSLQAYIDRLHEMIRNLERIKQDDGE